MKKSLLLVAGIATFFLGGMTSVARAQETPAATDQTQNDQTQNDQAQNDQAQQELTPEQKKTLAEYRAKAAAFMKTVHPQTGEVPLASVGVKLDIGKDFYFLDSKDARKVLEKLWQNPPSPETLGLIFPKDEDPYFYSYAVEVTFDDIGYVSDKDAAGINYTKLLKKMKKQTKEGSAYRVKQGYQAVELLDWAEPPKYDPQNKRLYWGKLLHFDGEDGNTLNYNLRFLGRKGVMQFNYIADADSLGDIKAAMPVMSKMVSFYPGRRYEDFNKSTDKVAAYGVAGLIAGGLIAKKVGLLGVFLLFLKKGWIIILAAGAGIKAFFSRMFGGGHDNDIG